MLRTARFVLLTAGFAALLVSPAFATVVNPGAEHDGGWSGSGARFASYGEGPGVPSAQFSAEDRTGARLFALGPAGRFDQVLDVSGLAASIDTGATRPPSTLAGSLVRTGPRRAARG